MSQSAKSGVGTSTNMFPASKGHMAYYGNPVREAKLKERERFKFMPLLNQLIYGKKYHLPQYRQADYHNQEGANRLFSSNLLRPMQDWRLDDVQNVAFANTIAALNCRRPQLWLEREYGEYLLGSELPLDMTTEEIHWRWPQLRVHLPKGLIGTPKNDLLFLDICFYPKATTWKVPEPYAGEIAALAREYGWSDPTRVYSLETKYYTQDTLMLGTNFSGPDEINDGGMVQQEPKDFALFAVVRPLAEAVKLGSIYRVANDEGMVSPVEINPDENAMCNRALHLTLQILLYMGSVPIEYEAPDVVLRKSKQEGQHTKPALIQAKFVGASQLKPKHAAKDAPLAPQIPYMPSGKHLPAHWKSGHWKWVHYGPKNVYRRRIWVLPYPIGALREGWVKPA